MDLVTPAAEIAEFLRGVISHIGRVSRNRAVFRNQAGGEFGALGLEQCGQLEEQIAPLIAGQGAPGRRGLAGRLDGAVDVARIGHADFAGDLAGAGIDMRERVAAALFFARVADDDRVAGEQVEVW